MEIWKKEREEEPKGYFLSTVIPALEELKTKLKSKGKEVDIETKTDNPVSLAAKLTVLTAGEEEFSYTVITNIYRPTKEFPQGYVCPYAKKTVRQRIASVKDTISPLYFHGNQCNYSVSSVSKDKIIEHFRRTFTFQLRNLNI